MKKRLLSLLLAFVLVLGMLPASAFAVEVPAGAPFTDLTTNAGEVGVITQMEDASYNGEPVPYYHVQIPVGATEIYVTHPTDEDPFCDASYDSAYGYAANVEDWSTSYLTYGFEEVEEGFKITLPLQATVMDWSTYEEVTYDFVADEDGYVGYAVAVERNDYSPICFFSFEYADLSDGPEEGGEEELDAPFLSIKINGEEVAAENIVLKNPAFQMGDIDDGDGWDLIHEAPYYVVTVPCGTTTVDVTYPGEPVLAYNTENNKAHGYATVIDGVDAVSGATVKGKNNFADYTKNSDNTQTVAMPVTGYALNENGEGMAITLEDGSTFAAICFFSFKYDGEKHVYDAGKVTTEPGCETEGVKTFTCSCGDSYTEPVDATGHNYQDGVCGNCGEADPDYVVPGGAEIPDGAPFTALTTDAGEVGVITQMEDASYYGEPVPYYHVQIPVGATAVYVTHPTDEDPFCDASYGSAYGYAANVEDWSTSGVSFEFEEVEEGFKIALPLQITAMDWGTFEEVSYNFVADEDGYVGYAVAVERNDYSPICFFSFEYAEAEPGEHIHSYDEGVVTTQPGCETKGVKTFTCSCGESYTEEIPAIGHKWNDGEQTKDPTCNDAGEKTYTCQNDGSHTKTEAVAKLGHKYDDGVVDPAPTCTEAGTKTYTCSQCAEGTDGHTKTESVAALGHNYADGKCQNEGCDAICPQQDENGVFLIGTYEELLWFATEVNNGNTAIKGKLIDDITLPEDWVGIGNSTYKFAGEFDGQNYTVTLSGSTWGLFAYVMGTWNTSNYNVKTYAIIKNVVTAGSTKNAPLAQRAGYVKISNCINKADVVGGNSYIGGIVGNLLYALQYNSIKYTDVLIENCINEGDISGVDNVGGILGEGVSGVRIHGCVNTGNVSGTDNVGGLAGYLQEVRGTVEIKNSYNTGKVTGNHAAGIVGKLYNSVSLINCYNAGEAEYGIAGSVYNSTATASNIYYRYDLSSYGTPESFGYGGYNTTVHGVAKSSGDMGTAAFAALLGDAFKESCGGAVLTWQTAKEHNLVDGVCYDCKAYHDHETAKAKFQVHKGTGGYEIEGDTEVLDGNNYTFSVKVLDGFYAENLQVYVNGAVVTANAEDVYTYKPTGHFYITVTGIKELEGVVPISLPGAGSGYRVVPCAGYGTTVESGKAFKFTVEFVNGFEAGKNFAVKVNGEKVTPDVEGIYTIENVIIKQTITVEGVDILPVDPVTVKIAITMGENEYLWMEETETIMLEQEMEVPYFDLELYGLSHVYYNPYCYVDEAGNIRTQQKAGNKETAYGVVTTLHALIYATEMYYLGYDEDIIGTGYSHTQDQDGDGKSDFQEALNVTANAGSTFTYMWGDGGNLNYHLNYSYPLAYEGWGSTSDQQALNDGDVISIHFITGSASGSAFGFFAVNDENNTYDKNEQLDHATVTQGETIKLTHYRASQGDNYNSRFDTVGNKELYWVEQGDESYNVEVEEENGNWYRDGFGGLTADAFKTNANGEIVIDTTYIEPGTYYIAARGGFTAGNGQAGSDGFVSRGAEAGPAYFVLTVEPGAEPEITMGDLTGDGVVDTEDAGIIIDYYYGIRELTSEQLKAADVNGDGVVDTEDAGKVIDYYYGLIPGLN